MTPELRPMNSKYMKRVKYLVPKHEHTRYYGPQQPALINEEETDGKD